MNKSPHFQKKLHGLNIPVYVLNKLTEMNFVPVSFYNDDLKRDYVEFNRPDGYQILFCNTGNVEIVSRGTTHQEWTTMIHPFIRHSKHAGKEIRNMLTKPTSLPSLISRIKLEKLYVELYDVIIKFVNERELKRING